MFTNVENLKLVLTNHTFFDQKNENEFIVNNYGSVCSSIIDLVDMIKDKDESSKLITFSLIGHNLFSEDLFEDYLCSLISFIKDSYFNVNVILYTDGLEGTEEQLQTLKDLGIKLKVIVNTINNDALLNENRLNLIRSIFPTASFVIYLNPNCSNLYDIMTYYNDHNAYNIDVQLNTYQCHYNDEYFNTIKDELAQLSDYIIDAFESNRVPTLFNFYKYYFWKAAALQYCSTKSLYRCIPQCMTCGRCGVGVSDKLILNYDNKLYTCLKNFLDEDIFCIGTTANIDTQKVDNLISMNFTEELNKIAIASGEPDNIQELHYSGTPLLRNLDKINCDECKLNNVCSAYCTPVNYLLKHRFFEPVSYYCKWAQAIFDEVENIIHIFDTKKSNTLFKDYFLGSVKRGERYEQC